MNNTVWAYVAYLVVCIGITIWVARTLRRHGVVVLMNGRSEGAGLAEAYSHLLIVGFYLINFGAISYLLKVKEYVTTPESVIEVVSSKVGTILLVVGAMHFAILASLASMRERDEETQRVHAASQLRTR